MIKKRILEHSFVKREKRIFTINVGAIPPEQVEVYMQKLKERITGSNTGGLIHMMFNNTDPI